MRSKRKGPPACGSYSLKFREEFQVNNEVPDFLKKMVAATEAGEERKKPAIETPTPQKRASSSNEKKSFESYSERVSSASGHQDDREYKPTIVHLEENECENTAAKNRGEDADRQGEETAKWKPTFIPVKGTKNCKESQQDGRFAKNEAGIGETRIPERPASTAIRPNRKGILSFEEDED